MDGLELSMNFADPNDRVLGIEKNNGTIQERFWVGYCRLLYSMIYRLMIRYLVMVAKRNLNLSAKEVIFNYYDLHMIPSQLDLYYKKHCKNKFGIYFQASRVKTLQQQLTTYIL